VSSWWASEAGLAGRGFASIQCSLELVRAGAVHSAACLWSNRCLQPLGCLGLVLRVDRVLEAPLGLRGSELLRKARLQHHGGAAPQLECLALQGGGVEVLKDPSSFLGSTTSRFAYKQGIVQAVNLLRQRPTRRKIIRAFLGRRFCGCTSLFIYQPELLGGDGVAGVKRVAHAYVRGHVAARRVFVCVHRLDVHPLHSLTICPEILCVAVPVIRNTALLDSPKGALLGSGVLRVLAFAVVALERGSI
jgi:hypothetical protein